MSFCLLHLLLVPYISISIPKTRVFIIILLVNERIRSWIRIRTNITDPGGPITSGSVSKNWVYEYGSAPGSSSFFQKLTG
jgi:hypothetical protein